MLEDCCPWYLDSTYNEAALETEALCSALDTQKIPWLNTEEV